MKELPFRGYCFSALVLLVAFPHFFEHAMHEAYHAIFPLAGPLFKSLLTNDWGLRLIGVLHGIMLVGDIYRIQLFRKSGLICYAIFWISLVLGLF